MGGPKIWINDMLLDSDPNQKLTINNASSAFENEAVRGMYSYPFQLPLTVRNRRILNNVQELNYSNEEIHVNCEYEDIDKARKRGLLYFDTTDFDYNSNGGKLSCSLATYEGEFWAGIIDVKLTNLKLGGPWMLPVYPTSNIPPVYTLDVVSRLHRYASDIVIGIVTDAPFVFPMMWWKNFAQNASPYPNENWFEICNDIINYYESSTSWYGAGLPEGGYPLVSLAPVDHTVAPSTSNDQYRFNRMVPMFYLKWILQKVFAEFGYNLTSDLFNDADFNKIHVLNNWAANEPRNTQDGTIPPDNFPSDVCDRITPASHMPDMLVADFLNAIAKEFCANFDFNGYDVELVVKKTRLQKAPVVIPDNKVAALVGKTLVTDFKYGINLNYNAGNDAAFKTVVNSDVNTLNPVPIPLPVVSAVVKGDVPDVATLALLAAPAVNDIWLVTKQGMLWMKKTYGFIKLTENYINYYVSEKALKIDTGLAPVAEDKYTFYQYRTAGGWGTITMQLPIMDQQGGMGGDYYASYYFHDAFINGGQALPFKNPMTDLRLAFYHGLQYSYDGVHVYPYASGSQNTPDAAGDSIGTWHLGLYGYQGVYKTFYADWANALSNTIKWRVTLYLSADEAAAMQLQTPYLLLGQLVMFYKLSYNLDYTGVVNGECYVIKPYIPAATATGDAYIEDGYIEEGYFGTTRELLLSNVDNRYIDEEYIDEEYFVGTLPVLSLGNVLPQISTRIVDIVKLIH